MKFSLKIVMLPLPERHLRTSVELSLSWLEIIVMIAIAIIDWVLFMTYTFPHLAERYGVLGALLYRTAIISTVLVVSLVTVGLMLWQSLCHGMP